MRNALSLAPLLLVLLLGTAPAAGEEGGVRVPPGARIRLEPERTAWRLGENVIVRYIVENVSDETFTVDWGGDSRAVRPIRNLVDVYDESGALLEDPWPNPPCFGGPGGDVPVTMSTPMVIEIPVPRYRIFERPGTYRIRVLHDLGWASGAERGRDAWMDGKRPPDDDPRWVETTIELHEPPADQLEDILDAMKSLPPRGDQTAWRRNRAWSDFETLRHPAYLEALVKRARARGSHERQWLEGIRSIATPEATRSLIDLVTERGSVARAEALLERVPAPEFVQGLIDYVTVVGPYRQTQERLARTAWRTDFAEPIRAWARANLGGRYEDWGRHAAYLLAAVGEPEDLPALLQGIDESLQYSAASPSLHADAKHRGRLYLLYLAATQLLRRGARPPVASDAREEIVLALLWIRERGEEAFGPYETKLGDWLNHEEPAIRDLTLRCLLAHPLPEIAVEHLATALDTEDRELRMTVLQAIQKTEDARFRPLIQAELRRADEDRWIRAADAAADGIGIDFVARARIHAAALEDEKTFRVRMSLLMPVFESAGWGSSGTPDADERTKLREAWTAFIDAHAEALGAGKRFGVGDPAVAPLIPSTHDVRPPRR